MAPSIPVKMSRSMPKFSMNSAGIFAPILRNKIRTTSARSRCIISPVITIATNAIIKVGRLKTESRDYVVFQVNCGGDQ